MVLKENPISLVHFMAYPGPGSTNSVQRGEAREEYLLRSLQQVLDDPYFGGIEVTRIKHAGIRQKAAKLLRESGKHVIFGAQPVQLINEDHLITSEDISSRDETQRQIAVSRIKECIDQAMELGAKALGLISGRDPGTASGLRERQEAMVALVRSLDEICLYAKERSQELQVPPLEISLELFDRIDEPGCKNQLIGPTEDAIAVARQVRDVYGHSNFGLLYDLSHMPLLKGISFEAETPAVLKSLAPYLNHIHIGSCVTDRNDPLYGDSHPRFDYPGSCVGEEELAAFIKALVDIDYKGYIGIEVMPLPKEDSSIAIESAKAHLTMVRHRLDVNYSLGSYFFQTRRFFTEEMFDLITETRIYRTQVIEEAADRRERRSELTRNGNLVILAADHPARNVTSVGDDPVRMGDRLDYLGRVLRVLAAADIDGIMATPEIIEDLLIVDYLLKENGGSGLLDGRVLIGCMNRSGLAGVEYEMDDRMTAFTAERIQRLGMDGAKIMFRLDMGHYSRYSIQTIAYCAEAIKDCNRLGIPVFLEPLPVVKTSGGYQVNMEADALIKTIGIGAALGDSSARLWLKIPYVPEYHRVVRATTLPVLMLGGASKGNPIYTIQDFERGMGEGYNVRGAMVGRNVLYPGKDDPAAVAGAVCDVVHRGATSLEAVQRLVTRRGEKVNALEKLVSH
jgi:DhnA family fructose-bisphosphate aldolase class Ia/sugar phosphate isomerase/epimerase